ncbi:MAG: ABC transporter permease [Acidobacteriota bacterium]|nr:ABC transporter permease [Acidobacteriota bacterium]MDQ3419137.1 ABC transporter permease [Acidobacteriota bacterium]
MSWRGPWQTDAKQTARSLARSPWHVITVSLCLGIGVAVSVTVFSILAAILTGDLPGIEDRARIMRVYVNTEEWGHSAPNNASVSDYDILEEGSPSLPSVAAAGRAQFAVRTSAGAAAVQGAFVSGNYFQVLGTRAALGRLLTPDDDRPGAAPSVVLSHAFWTAQLGAPADVVGSTIVVGGHDMQVVGVAPQFFSGTDVGDLGEPPGLRYRLYLPLALSATMPSPPERTERWLAVVGRAVADRPKEVFAAEMQPLASRIEGGNPADRKNATVLVLKYGLGPSDTPAVVALIVMLMMAAPITVLLIGCANVANLQLVRTSLRSRELAVRLSIGASRGQLVRLLAFESVFLALAACATGALGTNLLLEIAALVIPFHVSIDWPVLAFIVLVAGLVVLATGIIPAWVATRSREARSLTAGSRSPAAGTSRVRRALVVAQIALSLLLLLTAGLFTRSIAALSGRLPPSAADVVVAEVRFNTLGYTHLQRTSFIESLRDRLQADGRVQAVGYSTIAPLRQGGMRFWLPADGPDRLRTTGGGEITPDWFDAAGTPLLRGRTLTPEDVRLGNAAVVDQAFVDKYRLPEPVLGTVLRVEPPGSSNAAATPGNPATIQSGETVVLQNARLRPNATGPRDVTIVGVVANGLSRPMRVEPQASLYLPLDYVPDYLAVYVRSGRPMEVQQQVRETMAAIDRDLRAIEISTLADRFMDDASDIRLLASAASGLGAAALLLAVAGVYSVIAFFVSLRTHEFGIRLAIGAQPRDITNLVALQASKLVGVGLLAGFVMAVPVLVLLGKAFPYTSAFDPLGLLVPVAALAFTALLAAGLPARRAARVDPCTALRSE